MRKSFKKLVGVGKFQKCIQVISFQIHLVYKNFTKTKPKPA